MGILMLTSVALFSKNEPPRRGEESEEVRKQLLLSKRISIFFLYGFEKNEKSTITANEGKVFKIVAKELLSFSDMLLREKIKNATLVEVLDE